MIVRAPIAPPATLPAEKLPQYRMELPQPSSAEPTFVDGKIRFAITHPDLTDRVGRPLRIDASIKIDGKPFDEVRSSYTTSTRTSALAPPAKQDIEPVEEVTPVDPPIADAPETEDPSDDDQEAEEENDDEDAEEKPPVTPATVAPYTMTTDTEESMRRFAEAIGDEPSDVDAKWLLDHWTLGPPLLVVHPYFQSFRSDQRPAFAVLDRNRDGTVSQEELAEAVESFRKCDANRDEVVDALEIAKAADSLRDPASVPASNGPLLWLTSDLIGINESDPLLYESVRSLDKDQDGTISDSEVKHWTDQPADIAWSIDFSTTSPDSAHVDVVGLAEDISAKIIPSEDSAGIDIELGSVTIRLCGVQHSSSPALAQSDSGQVSLGAIVDGYPLLPNLDPNDDGRFTIRELRELNQLLQVFDRDGDQTITRAESLPPIRVCIGLGPTAHLELADVRATTRPVPAPSVTAPEWFRRMDRNQDSDLSRSEFPGTDEQFRSLDADGDELIDANEAETFEQSAE
ncbi:calmodulin [Rhodopirellula bahusiensis]